MLWNTRKKYFQHLTTYSQWRSQFTACARNKIHVVPRDTSPQMTLMSRECVRNLDLRMQVHSGELWVSKSAAAHSTRSHKISGCKRWCPKDLRVCEPAVLLLTHSHLEALSKAWRRRRQPTALHHIEECPTYWRHLNWPKLGNSSLNWPISLADFQVFLSNAT